MIFYRCTNFIRILFFTQVFRYQCFKFIFLKITIRLPQSAYSSIEVKLGYRLGLRPIQIIFLQVAFELSSQLSSYCPVRREVVFAYSTKRFCNFSRSRPRSTFIHNGTKSGKLRSRFAGSSNACSRVFAFRRLSEFSNRF